MQAKGQQIILVALALVLVVVLFLFGKTYTLTAKKDIPMASAHVDQLKKETISDDEALRLSYAAMPQTTADSLKGLQLTAHNTSDWQTLGKKALQAGDPILAAYSTEHIAALQPQSGNWAKAGDYYSVTFQSVSDTVLRAYAIQKAISSYEKAIDKDSANIKNYVKLASCYTDGTGEVMKGVLLLRANEKRDSLDSDLNLMLGRLAIMSQQYDKAVRRLSKLTARDPKNTEAWLHLGEAYRALGQKDKALEALTQCRATIKDEAARQQIDKIIQQIKNS